MSKTLLTYADYAALPDDGQRYELHAGDLWVTPTPGTVHQRVVVHLIALLNAHVRARAGGEVLVAPTDCILSDHTVLQPDILWVAPDRMALISERAIEGAPTLAVEVLSPSTTAMDLGRKRQLYAQHGVSFYWIVDHVARTIEAQRLVDGRYQPAGRLAGAAPVSLPPFDDLPLDPARIWA